MTIRFNTLTVSKFVAVTALALASFTMQASAASTSGLKVKSIEQTSAGNVWVHFDGNLSGATCVNKDVLYIDSNTTAGKNLLATVTASLLGNKTMNVNFSSAACNSNAHTMSWLHVY